ncbi:alpha-mannosidase 2 [Citrus sinensis]|nr:alpha-mannosidase 2 [Citrus sinensis]
MPFSSYITNPRRGTATWASSLLPSATKSKIPSSRKSRKRTALINFVFANFFTIALAVSVSFFLLTIFFFGVPTPISSHFKSKPARGVRPRKPISRNHRHHRLVDNKQKTNGVVLEAEVDLTTKGLYDKIQFLDVDGGAWKQGWDVKYRGDEWDHEKLKIFVVPHSHNDPGWKLTVDEYYDRQSRHILDTIVETLSKANSHYFAIIEQIMEGNMWLNDTIGFIPKNSWAIDPFGYSATMAYLLRRMGFENMLIQRTHYELKKELALHQNLEYIWRQSWDTEETSDIFVHMMPFYSYDIPHTCGPEPAVCCQFDFARMGGFFYEACPWRQNPVETNQENVQERALKLLDQYKKKSTLYRTNTLLVPLGDDFRYTTINEAEAQFRNYQLLFDYINSNPSLNVEAKFGTLDDYFRTLREEADRINYSRPGEIGSGQVEGFPSLSGDFFTYADRQQDYWSGYYVSRPFFKAVDRVLEQTLRATEMMVALLLGYCQRAQCEKLPMSFAYKLTAARRNLALFQHHDGVTGTAKDHVDLQIFMSKAIEVLLGIRERYDQNLSQFEPEQVRSKYDAQPVHKVINVHEGTSQSVVIFNPLEQTREEIVMVIVNRPDITVLDSNWTCVQSQISPELRHGKSKIFTGRHRLHWKATIPALGLQVYYIANGFVGCDKAKPVKLKYSSDNSFSCPTPYACSKIEGDVADIRNRHQILSFDVRHGLLQKISHINGSQNVVEEEIDMYSSQGSGAYLFMPNGDAHPITEAGGLMVISKGPLMEEAYSYPRTAWERSPISHSTRLYNGNNMIQEFLIEKEYHVELLSHNFNDRELIVRYKTDIDNKRIFYSDLNGFQMSRRETYDKIPLQGNYYPMPALAFMQGSNGQRFSVHSRQSLGVASLKDGWLEIMLDRRLTRDDGRGLGQGVLDNRAMNVVFHILVESNISSTSNSISKPLTLSPSLLSHLTGAHLNYPLHAFISKTPQELSMQPPPRSFSPLAGSLPCDLHIVNFKVPRPSKYSQQSPDDSRFVLILQRRYWDSSYCQKGRSQCVSVVDEPLNLFSMFKGLAILNAKATSLNLLNDYIGMLGYPEQLEDVSQDGHVTIAPMEIQAYKLEMRPNE